VSETDAFSVSFKSIDDPLGQKQWVPADLARRLERERDEWAAMCGRYKQERDEAREETVQLLENTD